MTTPLRWIFGGSNRPHHLRMSRFCAGALAALSITNPGVMTWGYWLQMPHGALWIVAAFACYGQEVWATADRDVEPSRNPPCLYWLPYGLVVRHRSWASHGFIVGTVIRGVYGWWPLLLALFALGTVAPFWAAWPAVAIGIGWMANDLAHLALDL